MDTYPVGHGRVFGVDVWAEPLGAKQLMGVLPDGLALPERLTGRELLTFLGRLRGWDAETVAQRTEALRAARPGRRGTTCPKAAQGGRPAGLEGL